MSQVLTVENLSLTLDKKAIFSDISFSLEKGTITILCGKNGAGKSRLLRTIKGLQKQNSGKIIVSGKDLSDKKSERLRAIALVFQDADLQIVGETVYRDCAFGPENIGLSKEEIEERCNSVLSLMGLYEKRFQRASTLSGGEKRRLAIAGVLAMEPDVILLDEPFANLDYPSLITVMKAIVELKKSGHTVLVVTHEAEKILSLSDKCLIMENGHLVFLGNSKDSIPALRENGIFIPSVPFEELSWLRQ